MSAAEGSDYKEFTIKKGNRSVDLRGGGLIFNYYESLFSPHITANVSFIDTGHSISGNTTYDAQERISSVYSGLPITGMEEISFLIQSDNINGELDYTKNHLYVNRSFAPGKSSSTKQAVSLNLISKQAIVNQEASVYSKFTGNISGSVEKLLQAFLNVEKENMQIDPCENSYDFIGNGMTPFEVICKLLSPKCIAKKTDIKNKTQPGFFFYETKRGFNFRSIANLIAAQPKATYYRTDQLRDGNNDYKISDVSIVKNQDVIKAYQSGVYSSDAIYFDPRKQEYIYRSFSLDKESLTTLGNKNIEIPTIDNDKAKPSRTQYHVLDVGTMSASPKAELNNNPLNYTAESATRYNILFSQIVNILIPCNMDLCAGDVITCEFEVTGEKDFGSADPVQSGKYLIVNLCHSFSFRRSFTSLTLVRDTYGLYT